MTPESPNVSIVGRYNLLLHLVCVFYAIVARAVLGPHSLKTGPCSKMPVVSRAADTIPRFTDPVLHCFVYPYPAQHYVDVWRAPALKFEKPQHTDPRDLTA